MGRERAGSAYSVLRGYEVSTVLLHPFTCEVSDAQKWKITIVTCTFKRVLITSSKVWGLLPIQPNNSWTLVGVL